MEHVESSTLVLNKQHLPFLAILTGAFLVPVNSTMITIGLSDIMDSLQINVAQVSWIVTIYLIIMTVTQPLAGKLGDMYGNRNLFLLGLLLFFIASLVCIYAPNLVILILGRAIQAIGGALITPNGTAILRFITPKEQLTKAFGLFGFAMSIGAAIGPLFGAVLISLGGWQSTFWVNIPLTIASFLIAYKFLPHSERNNETRLDVQGSMLLAVFLTTFILIVTNEWYTNGWLWFIFVLALLLFVYREKKFAHPLIDFTLFKHTNFTTANVSILLNNAIMYGTLLIMPFMLTNDAGYSLGSIGILLFAFSLAISLASWSGGYLDGRLGKRTTVRWSFICSALALGLYLFLPTSPFFLLAFILLFVGGIGSGLGVPSMQAASLESVAKEMSGVASGIYSTFRYIGSTAASVVISLQISYRATMLMLLLFAILGIFVSKGLTRTMNESANEKR